MIGLLIIQVMVGDSTTGIPPARQSELVPHDLAMKIKAK